MSISGIHGSSSSYQTTSSQSTTTIKALLEKLNAQSAKSSSSDTVTISVGALKALLQSQQQDGPPPLSNDQAAKMGADIKKQNADLFAQLDTDENGALSADEAEAGKDAIGQAMKDGSLTPPEKPEGAGRTKDSSQQDLIAQLITALSKQGLSNAEVAKQLGTTEQNVQEVLRTS